jgi:hypothetical protein
MKFEQQTKTKISPMILEALFESITVALNSSPKIIKGKSNIITDLIVKLTEYKNCLNNKGIHGSKNIIAKIIPNKINGKLRNITASSKNIAN